VIRLAPACRGLQRRRLLDLGLVPGTDVTAEMVAAIGDPTAYRVRGTLVALRTEQARHVQIARTLKGAA
jgi:DtxR family Mn-dependent transcriptional regulator